MKFLGEISVINTFEDINQKISEIAINSERVGCIFSIFSNYIC